MTKNIVGGWGWWCEQYRLAHPEELPLTEAHYKQLMQKYIKGESPE